MAVNEIDARTRAVEKMKAEQGKELEVYNAAENQLLAIRNEQKQNIAAARLEAAAAQQQNATIAQAAELVGSSSGATVQAPVNAATQEVLGKYGMSGPTVTKSASTQKSANTQQITKQNIVINNYNTTNNSTVNNTTTNVPNTGPVQGRPVVVNRDDTGRFKVWVNNVLARQNEQAAIRDKEYQRRDSALTRSANKMTRKLEAISSTISRSLDPRRVNNNMQSQLKTLFRLMGLGIIVANWPKLLNGIKNIENIISKGLTYLGFNNHQDGQETGLLKDLKYIFLGKNRADNFKGGFIDLLKEFFTGDGGVLDTLKKKISLWMEYTGKTISAIRPPETSALHPIDSMKNIALYLGQVISAIFQGPGGALKTAAKVARQEGVDIMTNESDLIHKKKGNAEGGGSISYGDAISVSSNDANIGSNGKYKVQKEDINQKGDLVNNMGASLRQSAYIGQNILDGRGTGVGNEKAGINVSGILEGLDRLNKTAAKNKTAVVDPRFLLALEKLGVKFGNRLENKKKDFGYVAVKKTDDEKAQEFAQNKGIVNTVQAITGAATGITAGALTMTTGPAGGLAAIVGGEAANELATQWAQKLASEEYTYKLRPYDSSNPNKFLAFTDPNSNETKRYESYYVLTKEDMDFIKSELGKLTGRGDDFSYDATDVATTKAMADYIIKMNPNRTLDESYVSSMQKLAEVEGEYEEYKAAQQAIDDQSMMNGLLSRTGEVASNIKGQVKEEWVPVDSEDILDKKNYEGTPQTTELASTTPTTSTKVTEQSTWDVDKAIQTVQRNAKDTSSSKCLRYVANAIDSGFNVNWDVGTPLGKVNSSNFASVTDKEAKHSGAQLLGLGFKKIDNNTTWQKGDIHVYQPKNNEKAGHIEIFDGTKWISDFNQKNPGFKWGTYAAMDTYRWKGLLTAPEGGRIIENDLLIASQGDIHESDGASSDATLGGLTSEQLLAMEGSGSIPEISGMRWDNDLKAYMPIEDPASTTVNPVSIEPTVEMTSSTGLASLETAATNLAMTDTHTRPAPMIRDEQILKDLLATNQIDAQVNARIAESIGELNNNMTSALAVMSQTISSSRKGTATSYQELI